MSVGCFCSERYLPGRVGAEVIVGGVPRGPTALTAGSSSTAVAVTRQLWLFGKVGRAEWRALRGLYQRATRERASSEPCGAM
jgi:hypothetical protein